MSRKFFITLCAVLTVFSLTTLAVSQIDRKTKDDLYAQVELFSYALTTIQSDYVDELTAKEIIYGALRGMLAALDPHSQFLNPEDYKELKTETEGKFGGLGIEISIRDGLLTVVTPIEDTPAWKAGLKAGDRIVKIEDKLTKDIALDEAVKQLRGKPGTDVHITVLREDEFKILEFTITREIIHIQDVKYTQILEDKIGYIRLVEFREDSAKEFRKALDQLDGLGAEAFILDLRNNPGGLLNVAIKITEEFLAEGKTIVSTKGRRYLQNSITISANKSHLVDWPMVVLINEGSASGSEILAGALQDNKRAILVGAKSFGKGSVQSVIPLPDGSGLRLTTSKYFTPSGRSIHGTGIEPDIAVKEQPPEEKEKNEDEKKVEKIFEDVETREAEDPNLLKLNKKDLEVHERLLKDAQVRAAINILKGIRVYQRLLDESPMSPATVSQEEQGIEIKG